MLCGDTVRQVWLNGSEKPERPMFIASGGLGSFCQNEPVIVVLAVLNYRIVTGVADPVMGPKIGSVLIPG